MAGCFRSVGVHVSPSVLVLVFLSINYIITLGVKTSLNGYVILSHTMSVKYYGDDSFLSSYDTLTPSLLINIYVMLANLMMWHDI